MNRKKEAAGKGTPRKTRTSGVTYFVIMAGGKGERFWPLSTGLVPKPFVSITGKKTLIELTVERALRIAPLERIFVVLGREHLPRRRSASPASPRQLHHRTCRPRHGTLCGAGSHDAPQARPRCRHGRSALRSLCPRSRRLLAVHQGNGEDRATRRSPCHYRRPSGSAGDGIRLYQDGKEGFRGA
jgi:hypothetical protein